MQPQDTVLYWALASQWVLSDETYQTNEGPSFPAHQYLIAGQSGGINNGDHIGPNFSPFASAENTDTFIAGCVVATPAPLPPAHFINMSTPYPGDESTLHAPCIDMRTVFDNVDAAFGTGVNWKYYTPQIGHIWTAPCGIYKIAVTNHLCSPLGSNNVVLDPTGQQFQTDVSSKTLPPLSYVVPCSSWSDHPVIGKPGNLVTETGPNWVNFIVNTIGQSRDYWNNTTIIVTWDDWGGWYDHRTPFHTPNVYGNPQDPNEYGYRVPMLIISPYLKAPGTVDHYPLISPTPNPSLRTQASILHYIETTFSLPSLGTADAVTDDLSSDFDYNRTPIQFRSVGPTAGFPARVNDCAINKDANLDG